MNVYNDKILLTSLKPPCKFACPPFAHNTGIFMEFPAKAIDRADCPSPTTTIPAIATPSICSHNAVSTFDENLI